MSVSFWVLNSPQHEVTVTYGEEGDGETDTYMKDVLPTCKFSNGNAAHILSFYLDEDIAFSGDYTGEWDADDIERLICRIRRTLCETSIAIDDAQRLFCLHTVLHSAQQFGRPVRWG